MDCEATSALLGPYHDGELADAEVRAVETHLADCPVCRRMIGELARIGGALQAGGSRPARPEFTAKIKQSLREENGAPARTVWLSGWQQIAAALALCAVTALATYGVTLKADRDALLSHDLLTAHVRSLLQENLIQVASSDSHTVRPWFAGKLDYSPTVVDLKDKGFPLIGGRIDYVDGARVGVAVYKRNQHWINLFIRPAAGGDASAPSATVARGYNLLAWTKGGFAYSAISDLSVQELMEFQGLL